MYINVFLLSDSYKQKHERMYSEGTNLIFSNMTGRKSRIPGCNELVVFGIQYFIKDVLQGRFNEFFSKPLEEVVLEYRRVINNHLGEDVIGEQKVIDLHNLGYVPLKIKALPEGSTSPIGVPFITIVNTHPDFFWLTNFIESILSAYIWGAITAATISREYLKLLNQYALDTVGNTDFVKWQAHCFALRGLMGLDAIMLSGGGHLTCFTGSDSIPAITWLEKHYNADCEKELVAMSVPASEHSVSCSTAVDYIESLNNMEEIFNEETQQWEFSRFIPDSELVSRS